MRLAVALFLVSAAMAADSLVSANAQQLFDRVREKVLENTRRVPRYTCTQTIDRTEYLPRYRAIPARCEALPGNVSWHDRLRLNVAIIDGKETFAWAGARQFETTDIQQLTSSGSSGSGDFASFLYTVFGMETTRISLTREEKNPADLLALFQFTVPVEQSRYVYRSHGTGPERVVGFHGAFLVDEAPAELKRLTVEADTFPTDEPMCRVEDVMDYHRVKIGDGDFLLPETSKMTVLFKNGKESKNETRYSDCREYGAESSIHFNDDDAAPRAFPPAARTAAAPAKLPPNLRLQIGLKSPIRSETAAAGDAITGSVLRDVKGFATANDVVHGRILRLEQFLFPAPRWVVALRFDSIEHNGVERVA